MRFFHLSDLHIGKQLHYYNLKEDQQYILQEVVRYTKKLQPDAIVIAGDIYDKSVPSAEAVSIFDEFLTKLSKIDPAIPVMMIAGNHDSAERLDYASRILQRQRIYIAGNAPENEDEHIQKIVLEDEEGVVNFYLLPFLKPGYVRGVFQEKTPESYQEAIDGLLERETIDWSERNVLVSHQFYTGVGQEAQTCDSERFSVGGLDRVETKKIQKFDYAALGHLHGAQRVGADHVRYCGTLLKYSVSESEQEKCLHVVTLGKKTEGAKVECLPLHPLREVRKVRGMLSEVLELAEEENRDDYISVTLTDEVDPYKPKEQLERVYSHILEVRVDNARTRQKLEEFNEEIELADPLQVFAEFFEEIQGRKIAQEEQDVLVKIFEKAGEE